MSLKKQIFNNHILAISIGLVYIWFGGLKYFTGLSPAEDLAINTIDSLTFSLIPSNVSIILLAIWETGVGLLLIINVYRRPVVIIALAHMVLTFTPLFLFPELLFNSLPISLTLLGQYILKNIIIASALITLYNHPSTITRSI